MPLELEIIRATEFVRMGAQGKFDLAASKSALATLAEACRKRGIDQAVVDLRATQSGPNPVLTPADLAELVRIFPDVGFDRRRLRLAILYRSDPHKRARLFAFLSTLHGWSVSAFGDFEAAVLWLSGGEPPAAASRAAGKQVIPIRFPKPAAAARRGTPSPRRAGSTSPRGRRSAAISRS
jgi:hypothetical protein